MKMYKITYTKEIPTGNPLANPYQVVGIQYVASKRQALAIIEHFNSQPHHNASIVELNLPEPKNKDSEGC